MRLIAVLLAAALLVLPGMAGAATRGFTLTDFDRIRLAGPYEVTVRVGPAVSARAEGTPDALDRAKLEVQGGTLVISLDRTRASTGDEAPAKLRIALTAPSLRGVSVTGSGSIAVDRARAQALTLAVAGAGTLRVDAVATDRLVLTLAGAGSVVVGGKAATAVVTLQGQGRIDGAAFVATDATVTLTGAGAITLGAGRTAKVTATGGGDVTVLGAPTCTVRNDGTGAVTCGRGATP